MLSDCTMQSLLKVTTVVPVEEAQLSVALHFIYEPLSYLQAIHGECIGLHMKCTLSSITWLNLELVI
jgi:hypothetical protein